jgi:hypothetical protein
MFSLPCFACHVSPARCDEAALAFGLRWAVDLSVSVLMKAAMVIFWPVLTRHRRYLGFDCFQNVPALHPLKT